MNAAEMLARDLVLRVCASDGEFRRDWLAGGVGGASQKRVVPLAVAPGVDPDLAEAIAGAALEMGADRLLACRTKAAFMYENVTVLPASGRALLDLAARWGQPDDFLVCLPDGSAAVLVSVAGYAVGAGPPMFVAALGGPDVGGARERFAAWARETGDQQLRLVAGRYGGGLSSRRASRRTLRPDLPERLSALAASVRERQGLTAVLRACRAAAGWGALAVLVITLLSAPRASHVLPVLAGTLWLIFQVFVLARTHTLSWPACLRMIAAGAVCATAIAAIEWLVAGGTAPAWPTFAGPVEEVAALVPVAALWLAARHRFTRLAAVDFALLGVASGAGFALLQGIIAALAAPGTGWHLAALLPGSLDAGAVRFPGRAVTTGLVMAGVGIALAAWPRGLDGAAPKWRLWRLLTWLLPVALLGLAMLDHYHYNAAAAGVGVPSWVSHLHAAVGDGHASRWALLVLIATAVAVDFRTQHRVLDVVPPLPGVPGRAGLARAARGSLIRTRLRWPTRTVQGRLARRWALVRVGTAEDLVALCHEVAFWLVVARRRGRRRGVFAAALVFMRQRRELAMREARAGGRVSRDIPRRSGLWAAWRGLTASLALGGAAAVAALPLPARHVRPQQVAWLTVLPGHGGTADTPHWWPGDLGSGTGALHVWFSQFIPGGQVLIVAAGLSMLVLLVCGWTAPVPLPSGHDGGPGGPGARRRGRVAAVLAERAAAVPAPGQSVLAVLALAGEFLPQATVRLLRGKRVTRPYQRLPAAHQPLTSVRPRPAMPRDAAVQVTQAEVVPAASVPAEPVPAETVLAEPVPAEPVPAEGVAAARPRPCADELSRCGWLFPQDRVRRWLAHAPEFGVGSLKDGQPVDQAELVADLTSVLAQIAEAAGSLRFDEVTFRNHPARAVVDRATGGAVFFTPAGEFTGCALLTEEQLFRLVIELRS